MITPPKYKDYYDLLELPRDVSLSIQKIKAAFMAKALKWHPDKAPTTEDVPVFTKVYEDIQQAYKILSNEETRRQYTDSQQTTNLELTKQERDVYYEKSDKYINLTNNGYQFDREKFSTDFELSRDKADRKIIEEITERTKTPVTKNEFELYVKSRDQDIAIPNIFNTENGVPFNANVFHQAFEYVKATQPSRGLEEYTGEPVASGLAELDDGFSGINFGQGLSLSGVSFQGVELGVAFNPTVMDLGMFTKERPQEQKITSAEFEKRVQQIQDDRSRLSSMKPEEFSREPSEIERLYAGLFIDKIEGLESRRL